MRRRLAATRVGALAVLTALVLTGCTVTSQDDETTSPTPSASPTATLPAQPLPATVPVGHGDIGPNTAVWAQGSFLHVESRTIDLAPLSVAQFVVVRGGVFFVDHGELWLTDLRAARPTGVTGVRGIAVTADGSAIRVDAGEPSAVHAWSALTGRAVPPAQAPAASVEDRLGRRVQVALETARGAVPTTRAPVPGRLGPGRFGILGGDGEPLVVYDATTRRRVPVANILGDGFELTAWTSGTSFFGLADRSGQPFAVLGCDLEFVRCFRWGDVSSRQPLVFESGT